MKNWNKLFISKSAEELPFLTAFCRQNNIQLQAQPMIRFMEVPFNIEGKWDVIFFPSVRAAHFFLGSEKIGNAEVACIGSTTAVKLKAMGIQVNFTGSNSGDPEKVASQFLEYLGKRTALIPCSDVSKRSIASGLPADQVKEVIVYSTQDACIPVEPADIYVFTSPSSFTSFLKCNAILKNDLLIAWGKTTAREIAAHGYQAQHILEHSSETELVEWLTMEK